MTTIAVSPADSDVIWSGSDDGRVHVTQNGGSTWSDISAGLPMRWITSIVPHPTATSEALITVSGFRWGEEMAHIYRTTNFGATWTPVDGNLPDAPVNDAWIDPVNTSRYFAATDVGVFYSADGGGTWTPFGTGLPNVVVTDFAYQSLTRELFAATYGRSIFSIPLDNSETSVVATQLNILRGIQIGGKLADTEFSDDARIQFHPGLTLNSLEPPVWLEFQGTSPTDNPGTLKFTLEASANSVGLGQKIELYDFAAGNYQEVDFRAATLADSVVEFTENDNAARFVEPGSGCVKARISWKAGGPVLLFPWTIGIDQVLWTVEN